MWTDRLEYSCDMRVSFSLLTDSQDDGANPWDAMCRLLMYVAEDGSKRHPLGRSTADEVLVGGSGIQSFLSPDSTRR